MYSRFIADRVRIKSYLPSLLTSHPNEYLAYYQLFNSSCSERQRQILMRWEERGGKHTYSNLNMSLFDNYARQKRH